MTTMFGPRGGGFSLYAVYADVPLDRYGLAKNWGSRSLSGTPAYKNWGRAPPPGVWSKMLVSPREHETSLCLVTGESLEVLHAGSATLLQLVGQTLNIWMAQRENGTSVVQSDVKSQCPRKSKSGKLQKIDFLCTKHIEGYWYGILVGICQPQNIVSLPLSEIHS